MVSRASGRTSWPLARGESAPSDCLQKRGVRQIQFELTLRIDCARGTVASALVGPNPNRQFYCAWSQRPFSYPDPARAHKSTTLHEELYSPGFSELSSAIPEYRSSTYSGDLQPFLDTDRGRMGRCHLRQTEGCHGGRRCTAIESMSPSWAV